MSIPNIRRVPQVIHGATLFVHADWRERLLPLGLADADTWMGLDIGERVSSAPATQCYRITLPGGDRIFFKRYIYTQRRPPNYWMLPGKACTEAWGYQTLRRLGIPTPKLLALGEVRRFGSLVGGFMVTLEAENDGNGEQWLRSNLTRSGEVDDQRALCQRARVLLEQLAHAHAHGFFHQDAHPRNFLLRESADGVEAVWIDCPRASRMWLRRWRAGVIDLWCLARAVYGRISVYEQYRLFRGYARDLVHRQRKRLFRDVQQRLLRRPSRRWALAEKPPSSSLNSAAREQKTP